MTDLHILIVEDESLIALELTHSIRELGHHVVGYATNAALAKSYLKKENINLILMDINLGTTQTGIALYKSLKTDIAVIYITAYKDENTILQAVETNPLAYLVKPHNEDELSALLHLAKYKLGQKSITLPRNTMQAIGKNYFYHAEHEKLYFGDMPIKLGTKELKLLQLLICAKGSVVSFETIEFVLWEEAPPGNSSLRTLIYRLRAKLDYTLIETLSGQGIRLQT
ncbi:MAG: DNA-binding response regulator [Epsilonproteobacteria bacterium]|nr:MAG: DNA-binding response regulator [Campylobacterota bacterium]